MVTRYDLLTSRPDNTGKNRYTKIGVMFPRKEGEGFSIKLEALPLPNEKGEVWISAFVPRENDGQAPRQDTPSNGGGKPGGYGEIDDVPFMMEWR